MVGSRLLVRQVIATAKDHGGNVEDSASYLGVPVRVVRGAVSYYADFAVIARRWQTGGQTHRGLVFTSDTSSPRTRHTIGRYVDAISSLMQDNTRHDDFVDRVHWL